MNIFGTKPNTPAPTSPVVVPASVLTPQRPFGVQKKVLDKRIPTFVGVGVLVLGLIAGGLLFSQGTGVFAPRATPQSTPKSVKLTNVTESSFTVTYLTDAASEGSVKYGTDPETPSSRGAQVATDDRVQLGTSTSSQFQTHHITIRGLQPNTTYYYLISSSGEEYDNSGQAFSIKTAQRSGAPAAAKTIYGSVTTEAGTPADGAIVYVAFQGAGMQSSLVKQSGSWAIPLSNARTTDGSAYATVSDDTELAISVQGSLATQTAQAVVLVADAQPVQTLAYGQTGPGSTALLPSPSPTSTPPTIIEEETPASPSAVTETIVEDPAPETSTGSGALANLLEPEEVEEPVSIIDTTDSTHQTVTSTAPIITGTAVPNVVVTIQVNSETQITQQVTTGADGSFQLDLEALKKELEPGEHTVTYSYNDPTTGELITETVTFTVTGTENLIAQAVVPSPSPSAVPFGSGNPVPLLTSPSPTATVAASPIASATALPATRSALPSTASGVPTSGSVGTTFALVFGGLFFIIAGVWSFWIAQQVDKNEAIN